MKQPMRARRKAMRAAAQHRKRSCARIDAANRTLAYAMRKPRDHGKRRSWSYIAQHVKKTDGSRPSVRALQRIVKQWPSAAKTPGRKKGWRKTSPEDDKLILEKFHELRPPGHGIDARSLRAALPMPLKNRVRLLVSLPFLFALLTLEVCRRTCIRRLAEKGFTPQKKLDKHQTRPAQAKRRLMFARIHANRSAASWKEHLQGVGDIKAFARTSFSKCFTSRRVLRSGVYFLPE